MAKGVMIKLVNGKEVPLLTLTQEDLTDVALAKNAKGEPSLAMKCELEGEPVDGVVTQRRLFKWGPMPKVVMYSLAIPTTLESASRIMGGQDSVIAYAIGNYTVEQDKANNGMEAKGSATPAAKAMAKQEKANPAVSAIYAELIAAVGRNASQKEIDEITRRLVAASK